MDLSQGLQLQMSQRLEMRMTPQMIQSMEMLQLPIMDLEQRIQQEMLENPVLEMRELEEEADAAGEAAEGGEREAEGDGTEDLPTFDENDVDWNDVYDEVAPRRSGSGYDEDDEFDPIESAAGRGVGFQEYLENQLHLAPLDPRTRVLAERILHHLDDTGYLREPLESLLLPAERAAAGLPEASASLTADGPETEDDSPPAAPEGDPDAETEAADAPPPDAERAQTEGGGGAAASAEEGAAIPPPDAETEAAAGEAELDPPPSMEELEEALEEVQRLDPPGVGARTVRECLLLQIAAHEEPHPLAWPLVDRHLDDLAANRLPKIAKSLGCDLEELKDAIAFVRTLEAHPGFAYGAAEEIRIRPDVRVEYDDGAWNVQIVGSPDIEISDLYLALYDNTKRSKEMREKLLADPERGEEFRQLLKVARNGEGSRQLRERYQSARWLMTAVQQRERTLLRVAREIVEAQKSYLAGQIDAPAPLQMQEIADRVGIDISTVSRAVKDKYMDSPRGLLPLRMFFTRAVGGSSGGGKERSNAQIMNRIREIIEAEDKSRPLKDDQIQALLLDEGIDIKRRTVAKYRNNLGFPSHSQRREY